ncbi:MAG: hypothetical protein CMJ48_11360 [Planctomycetaceae bacterium]|nr:hypothetical protein [Planctomycetaceae bacterium]
MPPEAELQQVSNIAFLLRAGGIPFLALGLFLCIFGVVLAARPTNRVAITVYAFLSLLPGLFAMFAVYAACGEFGDMAVSPGPTKPSVIVSVAGRAMSYGFFGLLGTILPTILAIIAFARLSAQSPTESPVG